MTGPEAFSAALQIPRLEGPPAYFTTDWTAAGESVRRLAELRPRAMIAGHGPALAGPRFRSALDRLARDFGALGLPQDSRYAPDRLTA